MKKGLTLIEVLVTAIILSMVLTGAGMFLVTTAKISDQAIIDSQAQNNLNLIYSDIANEVRNAKRVRASTANKDTLELTKLDNSLVRYMYDATNKKIRKQVGSGYWKDLTVITNANQTSEVDCSFANDPANINKVVFLEKLTYKISNNYTGKEKTVGLTGHGSGTSIACRNE